MPRKEKNTPRVSVLMANYNDERFLGAAIASILCQSFTAFELIVVDDGSSDQSVSLLKAYAKKDKRIRAFYFPKNRGFVRALNYGLGFSSGEYIARMDSDDTCHPDRLRQQVSYLDKHKRVHVVGCHYRAIDEAGAFCSAEYAQRFRLPLPIVFGRRRVAESILRFDYPVLHATIVCRRSTFLSVGGYRNFFPIGEDDDLYARIVILHGRVLNSLQTKLYYYRHYSSSTMQGVSYSFQMLVIFLISLSSEFCRRGFWDPLEEFPSLDSRGLCFRGVSSLLFLQDSLVFLPACPRARLYHLLRVVVILRRFDLKNFHHISLWEKFGITLDKQINFYISFCSLCFQAGKFRAGFLYCHYVFSFFHRVLLPTIFFILFKMFTLVKHYSHDNKYYYDDHLQFFYSLIFTTRWHYGLKHLLQAWYYGLNHLFQFFCFPFYCLFPSRLIFPASTIMSPPRISVVMANYNDERFLGAAIDSILCQSFTSFELIVVDDGSSDQSVSLLKAYAKKDKRIRAFYFPKNRGFVHALNYGLGFSRGEYIARMDSDDTCHPDRLRQQVSYLDKHKSVHVVGCHYRAIDEAGVFCSAEYAQRFMLPLPIVFGRHRVAENILRFCYPVLHPTIVCRRSTLLSVGGYRIFFPIGEDDDLYARIVILHGRVLDNLPEKLYYYRHHGSSTTQRFSYPFRMLVVFLISLSSEFCRRGLFDPLDECPSVDCNSLRFRGISNLFFLQDSLVFLPVCPRARLYCLLRIVVILRRFDLKDFHHISLWADLGITLDKQINFYISFCRLCLQAGKFRVSFLYLRYILSLRYYAIFFEVFNVLKDFSDKHLRSFRSLIFTKRFHHGLKHLVFAFFWNPFHTTSFFFVRFFVHSSRIMHILYCNCAIFFEVFKVLKDFSDKHLRSFRSLIFTKRFHHGLKHLVFAFFWNPFHATNFFFVRFFVHSSRIMSILCRKLGF